MVNQGSQYRLCIIGSGFSGAALLLHLARIGDPLTEVAVIGPADLGAGAAFGCQSDSFRLNVRSELMRLWPDDPLHFHEWAGTHIADPQAHTDVGSFYQRRDFARYMAAEAAEMPALRRVARIQEMATGLRPEETSWKITCADGQNLHAKTVILATGNPPSSWPFPMDADALPAARLVVSPWAGDWLGDCDGDAAVTIIGAGLTAMDAAHALAGQHHRGPITLIAPHGLLPPVQTDWMPPEAAIWPDQLRGSSFFRFMRQTLQNSQWDDTDWQIRFESLRVHISAAWQSLPAQDQRRLSQRLGWLWSLARFRAGPQAHASVHALLTSGQMRIVTGRVTGLQADKAGPACLALADGNSMTADLVVNCTGAGRNQLVSDLLGNGILRRSNSTPSHPMVTKDLALCDNAAAPYTSLFALGPMTAHDFGDVLGVPSIAQQAAQLASHIGMKQDRAQYGTAAAQERKLA